MGEVQFDTKVVRAQFDATTIRVYQAYSPQIAEPAIQSQRFGAGYKMERMTWIKPSFCWMLYRSGYASKPNQERVLGIDIKRSGFEWALDNSTLSSHQSKSQTRDQWASLLHSSPVRVQWDPERDIKLNKVEGVRAIQIGLSGAAVEQYVNDWIVRIEDMTSAAMAARNASASGLEDLHINERPYPLPKGIIEKIGASNDQPSSSSFS